jgi:hypothetical protein
MQPKNNRPLNGGLGAWIFMGRHQEADGTARLRFETRAYSRPLRKGRYTITPNA